VSITGIPKNSTNSQQITRMKKIIKQNEEEGMKLKMTQKEIQKFREKREREKELVDLKTAKRNVNTTGKKKPRRALVSRAVNYNIKFPKTGNVELEAFWTDSSEDISEDRKVEESSDDFEGSE